MKDYIFKQYYPLAIPVLMFNFRPSKLFMTALNLPDYSNCLQINRAKQSIFDPCRKAYVKLTPEEWVRQNFLQYLIQELSYPSGLLAVEMPITLNQLSRRCDIVSFNKEGKPLLIVECKAPQVKITQATFNQIATYNLKLQVDFLVVTNGLQHYCCHMNYKENSYQFLPEIPVFTKIS